jgi:hypothetical protein
VERGLEQVRARAVAPLDAVRRAWAQLEAAAPLGVEQRAEHARRVEVGQAEPVDRPVASDQGHGASITDGGVIADRRIAARLPGHFRPGARARVEWLVVGGAIRPRAGVPGPFPDLSALVDAVGHDVHDVTGEKPTA